ncbi:MAG: Na(+)-translocating NADH-quinone reductase subunit F [Flavobacteriales bacterium]|nr:Na(+)-translocating NADH-quinone reductase subunit F [Flavobacteriales bacterium]
MSILTEQELHNLAMNYVGKDLVEKGFEFLAIKSELKSNPQFVCVDTNNVRYFVVVRAIIYPANPLNYDTSWMETFKKHAEKHHAKILYAGVAIANAKDITLPVSKDDDYILNYEGTVEVL